MTLDQEKKILIVGLGLIGGRLGRKKGAELDAIYRDVAWELKHEADAEAARETASHTLESGAAVQSSRLVLACGGAAG